MRTRWVFRRRRWHGELNVDSINWPRFHAERWTDDEGSIWVDWGNGGSDPVWSICWDVPSWLARRLPW